MLIAKALYEEIEFHPTVIVSVPAVSAVVMYADHMQMFEFA